MQVRVLRCAAAILVQDVGRTGYADIGVPTSGAFDLASARLAQRLVGNPEPTGGLEVTMGAVELRTDTTVTVAVTGAAAQVRVAGRGLAINEVASWQAGTTLQIGPVSAGVRNYIAVGGGFAVEPVLGSVATDVLSGLGPAPLRAGGSIRLAMRPAAAPAVSHAPVAWPHATTLRIRLGPRADWFGEDALDQLCRGVFEVSPHSNRVGLRLRGAPLHRIRSRELPSEPLQRGAVQVPPNGHPIIMGPDHPTTGGYPVIATVLSGDWDALAHLRPGDPLRFQQR